MTQTFTRRELLAHIAQDYYLAGLTIAELSEKHQMSRYLMTKAIDEALETGVVSIQINTPIARNFTLETALKKRFNIPHVAVINAGPGTSGDSNVMEIAAQQLQLLIADSHVVGMSWGETIFAVIERFEKGLRDDLTFTQFLGENMKYSSVAGSTRMVERAAAQYETNFATLPAPLYVVNDAARAGLFQEPAFQPALNLARKMDLLFCGLGTIDSIRSIPVWKAAQDQIFPEVDPTKIAGVLYGRPYDINGQFLNTAHDTVVGLPIADILATPRRVGVLKSKFKTDAALGALRGQLLPDMVMSEGIAQRLLVADAENG